MNREPSMFILFPANMLDYLCFACIWLIQQIPAMVDESFDIFDQSQTTDRHNSPYLEQLYVVKFST